jgi:hypothetical protein
MKPVKQYRRGGGFFGNSQDKFSDMAGSQGGINMAYGDRNIFGRKSKGKALRREKRYLKKLERQGKLNPSGPQSAARLEYLRNVQKDRAKKGIAAGAIAAGVAFGAPALAGKFAGKAAGKGALKALLKGKKLKKAKMGVDAINQLMDLRKQSQDETIESVGSQPMDIELPEVPPMGSAIDSPVDLNMEMDEDLGLTENIFPVGARGMRLKKTTDSNPYKKILARQMQAGGLLGDPEKEKKKESTGYARLDARLARLAQQAQSDTSNYTMSQADRLQRQIMAESSGNPKAVSPAGAKGLLQIMPATQKDLEDRGLIPRGLDPFNPDHSRRMRNAKINALSELSWIKDPPKKIPEVNRLARIYASYNAGEGRIKSALEKAKADGVDIYGDPRAWFEYIPEETRGYLNKILFN